MSHATLVKALYRSLLRGAGRLEHAATRRGLRVQDEVRKMRLPTLHTAGLPAGWGAREAVRAEFAAHAALPVDGRAQELVDIAFEAMRQVNVRADQLESGEWRPKAPQVQLGVGTVGQHQRYMYRLVVIGWDTHCTKDDLWIRAMGVDRLKHGRNQPFYYCLADVRDRPEGHITYVAQESILPLVGRGLEPIAHPLVDSMFSSFIPGTGYIANEKLRLRYPEDVLPESFTEEVESQISPQFAATEPVVAPEALTVAELESPSIPATSRASERLPAQVSRR